MPNTSPLRARYSALISNPYVNATLAAMASVRTISPDEARAIVSLAAAVVRQGKQSAARFKPGVTVQELKPPYHTAVVVGNKPAGFDDPGDAAYVRGGNQRPARQNCDLIWTMEPGLGGITQSWADDWKPSVR